MDGEDSGSGMVGNRSRLPWPPAISAARPE